MKVSILGMGAFGIALTKILNKDIEVSMWTNFEDELEVIKLKRENPIVLPGVKIDDKIKLTTDIKECLNNSKIVFYAIPSAAMRDVAKISSKYIEDSATICILTKGIEKTTDMYMHEILNQELNTNNICMLAGPSFAIDVSNKKSLGMVISGEENLRNKVISVLDLNNLSLMQTSDILGVEIASAVKNVFAIICGMMNGLNESDSTKAAILTNIINDFRLVIGLLGGKESTFYSYAGIGDLLLTCISPKSRNYTFGYMLGKGQKTKYILENMKVKTIEGLYTLESLYNILKQKEVVINSISLLYDIIYNDKKVDDLLKDISK